MTNDQVLEVVAYLNAAFPREALEEATVRVYAAELALLADHTVAVEAARLTARAAPRFPTIKEFRDTYHSVLEARKADRPALPEPSRSTRIPEWVQVWWWLRRLRNDDRLLPQMDEHGTGASVSLAEYALLRDEWAAAGSPSIPDVAALVAALAEASNVSAAVQGDAPKDEESEAVA